MNNVPAHGTSKKNQQCYTRARVAYICTKNKKTIKEIHPSASKAAVIPMSYEIYEKINDKNVAFFF